MVDSFMFYNLFKSDPTRCKRFTALHNRNVSQLKFWRCNLNNSHLDFLFSGGIQTLGRLEHFSLAKCFNVNSNLLLSIPSLPNLKCLELCDLEMSSIPETLVYLGVTCLVLTNSTYSFALFTYVC